MYDWDLKPDSVPSGMGKNLLLMFCSVLIGVALIEVGLRALDPFRFRSGWRSNAEVNFQPLEHWRKNQLGFHGAPIAYTAEDKVVLLVGDSQVECQTCPDGHMPEDYLREAYQKLGKRTQVFTLGAGGYGADQELLAVREYFDRGYRADLILLWQTLGNDMWNAIFPQHSVTVGTGHLKPTFRLVDGSLEEPSSKIGGMYCRVYLWCVVQQVALGGIERRFVNWLPPAVEPVALSAYSKLPVFESAEDVADEKTHWSIWLKPNSPRKLYGYRLMNLLNKDLEALAAAHHARFDVFDINRYTPEGLAEIEQFDFFKPGSKLVKAKGKYYLAAGEEGYWETSHAVNAGVPTIYVPVTIPNHSNSRADPHLNARGNEHVLTKLAADTVGQLQ